MVMGWEAKGREISERLGDQSHPVGRYFGSEVFHDIYKRCKLDLNHNYV